MENSPQLNDNKYAVETKTNFTKQMDNKFIRVKTIIRQENVSRIFTAAICHRAMLLKAKS